MAKRKSSRRATKKWLSKLNHLSNNELSAHFKSEQGFLVSVAWREMRERVIREYGPRCMRCRVIPRKRQSVNVDHIKPRRLFPELSLDYDNLQILCARCNKEKGNKHFTDYRHRTNLFEVTEEEQGNIAFLRDIMLG